MPSPEGARAAEPRRGEAVMFHHRTGGGLTASLKNSIGIVFDMWPCMVDSWWGVDRWIVPLASFIWYLKYFPFHSKSMSLE